MPRKHLIFRACIAASVAVCGCTTAPDAPADRGLTLTFAALEAGGCEAHPSGSGKIPDGVATLAAIIEIGDAVSETVRASVASIASGRWVVGPLPMAGNADVRVYGCDTDGKVVYHGRSNGTSIPDQTESSVRMFLVPVGKLACTGNKAVTPSKGQSNNLGSPRAFAAAAALPTGDALIAGGIGGWDGDALTGQATVDTDVYEHDGGNFRKGPAMLQNRAWHHAIALDDHRVLVVGGVTNISAQGAQPSPLMSPGKIAESRPTIAAEIVDVQPDAAGKPQLTKAATVDVGVGTNFLSSALRVGDSILFVGGAAANNDVSKQATRISGLSAVADGGAGTTASITLTVPRVRPGLLAFGDGTVAVWGGSSQGKDAVAELGELIAPGATKGTPITITSGPAALKSNTMLATYGPAVAVVASTADKLTFVVAGGAPRASLLKADAAPSYLVVLHKDGKADLKTLDLGGKSLHAGVGATSARLGTGQGFIGGGLIALSSVAPCTGSDPECLIGMAALFEAPADLSGETVNVGVTWMDLGGPRVGIAAAALPSGLLLAGGQAKVQSAGSKGADVLDPTGRVLAGALSADEQKAICGK